MKRGYFVTACVVEFFLQACASTLEKNIIESLKISRNKLQVKINAAFKKNYLAEDFFVEYDEDIDLKKLDQSLVIMPFIMNVISIIWISGQDYYVDSLDARLYESLEKIKQVFKVLYPGTAWSGNLIPRRLVTNTMPHQLDEEKHIALLFSGGLDSTVSSYYLADKQQLLITAWGQWDVPLERPDLWRGRKERLIKYAKRTGHTNAFLKSNYNSFLNWDVLNTLTPEINHWRLDAIEGIGWAGLTAPILFQKGYKVLYIASSDNWELPFPTMAIPYIDDNISFSECHLKHHLFNYSRLQKIQWLAAKRKELGKELLEIKGCSNRTIKNCLACRRCLQTMCAMMLIGEDYTAYKYYLRRPKALQRIKERVLTSTVYYEDIYNYFCLARHMRELLNKGMPVSQDLTWLHSVTLDPTKALDVRNQTPIDWEQLHMMFPDIRAHNSEPFTIGHDWLHQENYLSSGVRDEKKDH